MLNRRGFIGSLAAAVWGSAARSWKRPIACVACGSNGHVTPLCPINNAAMAGTQFVPKAVIAADPNAPAYRPIESFVATLTVGSMDEAKNTIWMS